MLLAALLSAAPAGPCRAETDPAPGFPAHPVRIVVGLAAGGGTDLIARLIAPRLAAALGQPFLVDNKPGGNFVPSTDAVLKAPADGYTLMLAPSGVLVANPVMYEKLPYSPRDFAPVAMVCSFPLILAVNTTLPVAALPDFVSMLRSRPGGFDYSGSSVGFQLPMELFMQRTGTRMQFVQYKGSNLSVNAVLSGEVVATLVDSAPVIGLIEGHRIRGLAVTSARRIATLLEVPTMAEAGFPELEMHYWMALFARAGTAPGIVRKLEREVIRILGEPEIGVALRSRLVDPAPGGAADLGRVIAEDTARWSAVRDAAHLPRIP